MKDPKDHPQTQAPEPALDISERTFLRAQRPLLIFLLSVGRATCIQPLPGWLAQHQPTLPLRRRLAGEAACVTLGCKVKVSHFLPRASP